MRRVLISLFIVVGVTLGPVAAPASAICYDRVLRNGTVIHECR